MVSTSVVEKNSWYSTYNSDPLTSTHINIIIYMNVYATPTLSRPLKIIAAAALCWAPKLRWSRHCIFPYWAAQPSPAQPSPGRRWAEHRQWSPEPVLPCPKIFYWKIFKIKGLTLTARFPWIILEVWVLTVFDIPPFLKYFWTLRNIFGAHCIAPIAAKAAGA